MVLLVGGPLERLVHDIKTTFSGGQTWWMRFPTIEILHFFQSRFTFGSLAIVVKLLLHLFLGVVGFPSDVD